MLPLLHVRSADQSEYLGDRVGARVAVGHRAALQRDSVAQGRSEPAAERVIGLTPGYVPDVGGVVAGIEDYLEAEELEGQAESLGEAVKAIISGAEQLELQQQLLLDLINSLTEKLKD